MAVGANAEGKREVLGLATGESEAEPFWKDFLRSLTTRGLRGVKLVIADDHKGLRAAATKVLNTGQQRCRVHWMRNLLGRVGKTHRAAVAALVKTVFVQETQEAAREQWRSVADSLRERYTAVADLMDASEEDVLAYMAFPREHWTQIHSTNPLERLNKEIKRRTNVVGIFPNDAAIIRLVGALLLEQNDVYGPPPSCKAFRLVLTSSDLAVVYPALLCGFTRRRPLWFPRISGRTNGRTQNGSHHFIGLCRTPVRPVRHTIVFASQVGPWRDRTDYAANGCAP